MLKYFEDSNVVADLLESFELSDYYTREYDKDELKNFCDLLDYIEDTEGVRLPLIPVLDLYRLYTVIRFDCTDCIFTPSHSKDFINKIKQWAEESFTKCYS